MSVDTTAHGQTPSILWLGLVAIEFLFGLVLQLVVHLLLAVLILNGREGGPHVSKRHG